MSEAADAKLLPVGLFSRIENCRFRKDGRLGRRAGMGLHPAGALPDSATIDATSALIAHGAESLVWAKDRLHARQGATSPQSWLKRTKDRWVMPDGPIVENVQSEDPTSAECGSASITATNGHILTATVYMRVQTLDIWMDVWNETLGCLDSRARVLSGANISSVCIVGESPHFFVTWVDSNSLRCRTWKDGSWLIGGTVIRSTTAGCGIAACRWSATVVGVVSYLSPNLRFSRVNILTGAEITSMDFNIGAALVVYPAVSANSAEGVWVAYESPTSRDIRVMAANTSLVQTLAVTLIQTLAVTEVLSHYPVIARVSSTQRRVFWDGSATGASPYYENIRHQLVGTAALSGGVTGFGGVSIMSEPFVQNGRTFLGVCNSRVPLDKTYFLVDVSEDIVTVGDSQPLIRAEWSRTTGVILADVDASGLSTLAQRPTTWGNPSANNWVAGFPFVARGAVDTSAKYGIARVRMEFSGRYSWGTGGVAHGHFLPAAPLGLTYDGLAVGEAAPLETPVIHNFAMGGAGAVLTAGVYSWVAIYEVMTAEGHILRSAPSAPISVTLGGGLASMSLYCRYYYLNQRAVNADLAISTFYPRLKIYRTLVNGSTYYLMTDIGFQAGTLGTAATIVDANSDSALSSKERLYTQVGNQLPNAPAPPCRSLTVGDGRLMAEGLENPNALRWSKLFVEQEGPHWADDVTFSRTVSEPTTGAAYLDSTWYVFTASSIYATAGSGPDDAGVGDYPAFTRLSTDVGCLDRRSIVVTSKGIMFQASAGQLWLLPRGGGAPEWIGQPVRDLLTTYPVVRSATLFRDEQLVEFCCCTLDSSIAFSVLLQYDLRANLWLADFPNADGLYPMSTGYLGPDHGFAMTPAASPYVQNAAGFEWKDGTFSNFVQVITTGDIRPSGTLGQCRFIMVQILGEYRADSALQVEVTYDNGINWSGTSFNVTGLTTGITFMREFAFAQQKAEAIRIRLTINPLVPSSNTDTLVINALAIEVAPQNRMPRLGSGSRG